MIPPVALAVLMMVHGSYAACDETKAKELIAHMDQFNVMLGSFANLGSSVLAASSSKHAAAHATGHVKRDESHAHPTAHNGMHSQAQPAPSTAHGAVHTESPDEKLHKQIKSTYHDLAKKQQKLNEYSDACIPMQHKLHLASQMTNMVGIYVSKDKEIKAAGSHIVEKKKSKSKRTPEEKLKRRQEKLRRRDIVRRSLEREKHADAPAEAAWLTMDDSINGGYNNQPDELTSSTFTTTTSQQQQVSLPYYTPYAYNSPQLEPQYVTITSTGSVQVMPTHPALPAPHKGKVNAAQASAAASDDSDSDSGSDSGSDTSSDDESSAPAQPNNVSLPTPSSTHHNIIYRVFDGAFHLVTGTIHFVEDIFSKIFIVDELVQGGSSGNQNSNNHNKQDGANSKEIKELLEHAKQLYNVKA